MKEMVYEGEHLLIGNFGHLAVVLAFTTAILTAISYYFASNEKDELQGRWKTLARLSFRVHSISVIGIITALAAIIYNHYYEYYYAWQHSSNELPTHFIISCFWEGQEGSFLLWIFWHVVIGNILIRTAKTWEAPVMAVVALAQIMLASMLLGIDFGDNFTIGSSPFSLLRDEIEAPIFGMANYLSNISNGTGLNPLLQNYWMVIHPPTLFFGFAATVVPFAYAIAALWKKRYTDWVKPALPWALAAVMVLGTGIIMGGFWAYEALSFGGYWAWDPVENASLIPWIILIAGVHVMLINKSTKNALVMTYILILVTFLLVLYATYLTRSGVLNDTSAHSFAAGLPGQLIFFLLIFVFGTIALFASRWKEIPKTGQEENLSSREFWMFIGSLVLLLSGIQVIGTTSIPVFNLIPGINIAPPNDVIAHYNQWQMPFAIVIALLTAIGQYFKYKKSNGKKVAQDLLLGAAIATALTAGAIFGFNISQPYYVVFLFAGIYAVTANLLYLFSALKGKLSMAGASIAHIGFGVLLVGVLVSSANKHIITQNNTGGAIFGVSEEKQNDPTEVAKTQRENTENMLLAKNMTVNIGPYKATFIGSRTEEPNKFYQVVYTKLDDEGNVVEEFTLEPYAQNNPQMGMASNPDTKHYLSHDIFTYVSFDPMFEEAEEFKNPLTHEIEIGDTIHNRNADLVLDSISTDLIKDDPSTTEFNITAHIKVIFSNDVYWVRPQFGLKGRQTFNVPNQSDEAGVLVSFDKMNAPMDLKSGEKATYVLTVSNRRPRPEYIIMKAIVFPWINLVWAGTIIMVIGFVISIIRRVKEYRRETARN